MPVEPFDLVVLGSGQGGGPLAGAFAKAGRRVALIERQHVGGTCVNSGCTPTKTMVASARVAYLSERAGDYGVRVGSPTIDLATVRQRKRDIVLSFRQASERSLEQAGVELIRGNGRFVAARTLEVTNGEDLRQVSAARVVISTGTVVAMPPIPGLDTAPHLDSTSVMELAEVPEHLIVLGGGYVGLEFAQMFRRFGAEVTVVERGGQLLAREDGDVAEALTDILRHDGLTIRLSTAVTSVRGEVGSLSVEVESEEGRATITGSHLLVATGRAPATAGLNLKRVGIRTTRQGFVAVNSRLETSVPGVHAIGDVNGGPAFTHIAYDDYRILRTNLLEGGKASTRGRQVPYVVFTDPQLGRIGMTERAAREAGKDVAVAVLPMSRVARALETDEPRGLMKAVVDRRTDRLLGAAILGPEGGETAAVVQMAMLGRLKWQALRDGIFAHPTWAEALNNLFGTKIDDRR